MMTVGIWLETDGLEIEFIKAQQHWGSGAYKAEVVGTLRPLPMMPTLWMTSGGILWRYYIDHQCCWAWMNSISNQIPSQGPGRSEAIGFPSNPDRHHRLFDLSMLMRDDAMKQEGRDTSVVVILLEQPSLYVSSVRSAQTCGTEYVSPVHGACAE